MPPPEYALRDEERTAEVVVVYGPGRELHVFRSTAPPLPAVVRRSSFGMATKSTWPSSY